MKSSFPGTIMLLLLSFLTIKSSSQNVVTITDCNMNGWTRQTQANTSLIFKNEPSELIVGNGSIEFVTTTNNFVRLRNTNFHNTPLSSLTELSYSCFIKSRENTLDANYLVLQIDRTGDGVTDDRLEFDPRFQTGSYIMGIGPDQGSTQIAIWQTWDALRGGWWVGPEPDPDDGGEMFTLATYISRHPNARIVNDAALGGGGIRLSAGAPFPLFARNYYGYADNFRIGVNGVTTIYNFEFSIANAGPDKNIIYGYGANCTTLNGIAEGGVAPHAYSWSQGVTSNQSTIEVCPTTTTTYKLTVADANGCTRTDEATVFVNDVRCGNKMEKVKVCHNGDVVCISKDAVNVHLNHGDQLGSCAESPLTKAGVEKMPEALNQFKLSNYPNPFSNSTSIKYELSYDANVSIKIYDATGKEILTLINSSRRAGRHQIEVNARNFKAGFYYLKIIVTDSKSVSSQTNKMLIVR